jgi:hypothetical protein
MVWTDLSTARIVRFHEASCVVENGDRERFQKRKSCLLSEPVSTASAINEPARVPTIILFLRPGFRRSQKYAGATNRQYSSTKGAILPVNTFNVNSGDKNPMRVPLCNLATCFAPPR